MQVVPTATAKYAKHDEPSPEENVPFPYSREAKFRFIHISEIDVQPPKYIIRPYIEENSFIEVFGDPGVGKSLLGVDFACCVATSTYFHGCRVVEARPVCYVAGEGQNGIIRRFTAWSVRHGIDLSKYPLLISTIPAALCSAEQTMQIIEAINLTSFNYGTPALIIIDTVARNFGDGNESETRDMNLFISNCDRIRANYNSTILLLHHPGISDKTRGRGSVALKGALDAEYRLDKDGGGLVRLEATKMKDAELPPPMAFKIHTVELPLTDEDGRSVTSAVLDQTEYTPRAKGVGWRGKGRNQLVAVDSLRRLCQVHKGGVNLEIWRKECGMTRQAFSKVKASLAAQGILEIGDDLVKLI